MRDGTFFHFIKDYNKFKQAMDEHLVATDFRDFETWMYMRAMYSLLIKIPLFKIFFVHQLSKIAKKRNEERRQRKMIEKQHQQDAEQKQKSKEFAGKIQL